MGRGRGRWRLVHVMHLGKVFWVKAQLGPLVLSLAELTQLHVGTKRPGSQCKGFTFSLAFAPQIAEGLSLPRALIMCLLVTLTLCLLPLPLGQQVLSHR